MRNKTSQTLINKIKPLNPGYRRLKEVPNDCTSLAVELGGIFFAQGRNDVS